MKISVETTVAAPMTRVWQAYNTPKDIERWNAASEDWHTTASSVDLRPGGEFSSRMEAKDGSFGFDFDFAGTYTKVVENELIEYTFGDREASVEFHEVPGGVRVRVTFDAETENPVDMQRAGWQAILDSFARYVEAGNAPGRVTTNARTSPNKLVGAWSGRYQLWLGPAEPVKDSATDATVSAAAAGRFLIITYSWGSSEEPHDGVLMLRVATEPSPVDMVWVDSFHTMGKFMQFEGRQVADGSWDATTTWSIGDGPAWGWRIVVSSPGADELLVQMYVATPAGEESPAVESRYTR